MTTAKKVPAGRRRLWIGIGIGLAVLGGLIAFFGYDQELAYNGAWADFPGLATTPSGLLKLYSRFDGSIWPAVALFTLGGVIAVVGLIVVRVLSRPHIDGHLIWASGGVVGAGVAIHFSGIAVAGETATGDASILLALVGLVLVLLALVVFVVGILMFVARQILQRARS
jgi:hypothetical protein